MFRRKQPDSRIPYHPWAVPPMGSLGDGWDTVLDLPKDFKTAAGDEEERRKAALASSRRITFKPVVLRPPLNVMAIVSWVLVFLALTSTGPAAFLLPVWAVLGVASGIMSIYIVKHAAYQRGIRHATLAIIACVLILAVYYLGEEIERLLRMIYEG